MKAVSFLEYYKEATIADFLDNSATDYFDAVRQPFSFEKVVELFEGFEIDEEYNLFSNKANIGFYYDDYLNKFFFVKNWKYYTDEDNRTWCKAKKIRNFAKTIDEFIVLCNNLNIDLEWKN